MVKKCLLRVPSVLLVATLLLLSGCTPTVAETPTVTSTPLASATPTIIPSPSPAPTPAGDYPDGLPDLAQIAIDGDMAEFLGQPGVFFKGSEITLLEQQHSFVMYETYSDLWWLRYRMIPDDMGKVAMHGRSTDGDGGILGDCFIVVQVSPDRKYCERYYGSIPNDGTLDLNDEAACRKKVAQLTWSIPELEFSLTREGFPGYSGLGGNGVNFTAPYEHEHYTEETLSWDVFVEGDYWQRQTWKGLTAVSLISPSRGRKYLYSIDATLSNVKTYRGIGLGATHEEVMAAYPEIVPENWPVAEWGDQLVYESMPGQPFGDFLHFYFGEDGKVNRILLENIQD